MTKQQRLKILRILAGFDAKKLASALNISHATVSMWESPKEKLDVSKFSLIKLAELLGVNSEYINTGQCLAPGAFNVVWRPEVPATVQHQRATVSVINDLFPEILSNIGFDFGALITLVDGNVYLLGDRETRTCSTLLIVDNPYKSLFSRLFAGCSNIAFLPPVIFRGSIDDFDSQAIEAVNMKLGGIFIGDIQRELEQIRAKHSDTEIRVNLPELRNIMNNFLAVFLKDQPEEHHIAEITNLFVENLRTEQPGITTDDIQKILIK